MELVWGTYNAYVSKFKSDGVLIICYFMLQITKFKVSIDESWRAPPVSGH